MNTVMTGGMHYAWRRLAAYTAVGTGLNGAALDVACGTGDFAFDLARKPNVEHVVGLDFVPEMLTLAKGKAARQGLAAHTTFAVGDAHALPFVDDSFVCVTVGFGVRNFIDVPRALSEMAAGCAAGRSRGGAGNRCAWRARGRIIACCRGAFKGSRRCWARRWQGTARLTRTCRSRLTSS